ncbi:MAG TPA: protein kinase [Pyrinomonadaceae bacterium]|nr:protein kinase [Pyrinomonadaceae bacterium]
MSFCLQCGASVSPDDRFCGNCGVVLQPPSAAVREPASGEASSAGFMSAAEDGPGEKARAAVASPGVGSPSPDEGREDARESDASPRSEDLSEQFQPTLIGAEPVEPTQQAAEELDEHITDAQQTPPPQTESATPEPEPQLQSPSQPQAQSQEQPQAQQSMPQEQPQERQLSPFDDAPPVAVRAEPTGEASPLAGTGDASAEQPRRGDTGEAYVSSRTGAPFRPTGRVGASGGGGRSANKQLESGTLLNGRFEIVKKIGGGGMGAVYYARDKNLGDAPRAVKEMVQSNIDEQQHEKAIADFKRESMLLASLEHASIPTIYDYFYDESSGLGRFYLVMKYISGGDFLARLRNAPGGRIDELTVCDWGMQVADVLHYLHSQNPPIIYRDLKPANLMIDGNTGRVMLIDFGIARWVQKEEKGVTAVGTMGYAPPELFSGKAEARTDIYSLGATMFHLLTGADPQDNPLLIFDFTKNPRPRQHNPSLSNEMETILMRAVEYETAARFRSAADMRDALGQHLEKLRSGAVSYGAGLFPANREVGSTVAVEMVYCGFCGGRIAADDVFCAHCGARQPLASAAASARAARATAKLVVMGTTELNRAFELPKESNLVGRSDPHSNIFPEVDLSPFDPETKISRRHARIWRQGDTYLVEDLGSVNGTVVNETIRLGPRQPRTLEHGDKIRLGETTLHFLIG